MQESQLRKKEKKRAPASKINAIVSSRAEPNAIVAQPNLTRRSPQKDRQGARHDRVPQVSRQPQCMNQIVASPHTVVVKKKKKKIAHTGQLVLELGQGRVTGEAQARGRRKPPV